MIVSSAKPTFRFTEPEVKEQLKKILGSATFSRCQRMRRFLQYTVDQTLQGRAQDLKEYVIATAVYDKPESMDPRYDPIVRVEAGRLRAKLREYYDAEGAADQLLIRYQKRSYIPLFEPRMAVVTPLPEAPAEVTSIAVLPFFDMSSHGDQEHFCDSLTDELINTLGKVKGLRVVSRTTVYQFKGQAKDIREIGEKLNVTAVLEGSVRKSREHLRITAQLNSARDGYHLWAESFDRSESEPVDLQREISLAIAEKVSLRACA